MSDNNQAASNLVSIMKDITQQEIQKLDTTIICRIVSDNQDGTFNVFVEPDEENIISRIPSISVIPLVRGDYVYVYKIKNQLNNSFIIKKIGVITNYLDIYGSIADLKTRIQSLENKTTNVSSSGNGDNQYTAGSGINISDKNVISNTGVLSVNGLTGAVRVEARKQIFNDSNVDMYTHQVDDVWFQELPSLVSITNTLSHCHTSNPAQDILETASYSATITANVGYSLEGATVTVFMNGVDVSDVYADGAIYIASVTGAINIVISAKAGYVELSYIYSTGAAYVDTGIVGNTSDGSLRSVVDFAQTAAIGDGSILATRIENGDRIYLLHCYQKYTIGYGSYLQSSKDCTVGVRYLATTLLSNGSQTLDIDGSGVYTGTLTSSVDIGTNLYLFACNQNNVPIYSTSNAVRIYSCKIYKGNSLAIDLIPVKRTSDSVIAFYDRISGEYFGNASTSGSLIGEIEAPTVSLNSSILSWAAIDAAQKYMIYDGDTLIKTITV